MYLLIHNKASTYSHETSLPSGSEGWGPVFGFGQGLEWVQACLLGSAGTLSLSAFSVEAPFPWRRRGRFRTLVPSFPSVFPAKKTKKTNEIKIWRSIVIYGLQHDIFFQFRWPRLIPCKNLSSFFFGGEGGDNLADFDHYHLQKIIFMINFHIHDLQHLSWIFLSKYHALTLFVYFQYPRSCSFVNQMHYCHL